MRTLLLAGAAVLSLGACATQSYTPIVDGPRDAKFQSDLAACRQLATQTGSGEVIENAAGGAVVGAIIGSLSGNMGDGAAAGGGVGAVRGAAQNNERQKRIISNCMRGRGHNVVG